MPFVEKYYTNNIVRLSIILIVCVWCLFWFICLYLDYDITETINITSTIYIYIPTTATTGILVIYISDRYFLFHSYL